jgi:hypothetical protein
MRKRFNEDQIIGFLREADSGVLAWQPLKQCLVSHGYRQRSIGFAHEDSRNSNESTTLCLRADSHTVEKRRLA